MRWEVRLHVDESTIATLGAMARSDLLIASDSSFSYAAAALSSGVSVGMPERWRRYAPPLHRGFAHFAPARANGSVGCADVLEQWRRAHPAAGS